MENRNSLPIKHAADAVRDADDIVKEGMTGEQMALFSRHPKIKKALLGGWRFNNNYVIAGASGSYKSFYLNMLYQDFFDQSLNSGFHKPFKVLHFAFEMSAADEILRAASGNTKKSYRELLSTDEILSAKDYALTRAYFDKFRTYEIYYVEATGNVQQMYDTIHMFQDKFPDHLIIVGTDHTLLADFKDEKSEVELVSNFSKMQLKVRKELHNMNLQVVQLNADIEELDRINNPHNHYPKKKDLHGSKAIFQCADYVTVLHAPEKLGIVKYGPKLYDTQDLIAWHLIKARKGTPGLIRLRNKLSEGTIIEWEDAVIV